MELKLQKIGNSRGIRLPKKIIDACGISDIVEMRVAGRTITLTAKNKPRHGWAEAAAEMHRSGEDNLVIPDDLDMHVHDAWEG